MIEMLVTISILFIMTMLATASYSTLIANTRMNGEISGMLNGLKLARSEAIKRGQTVDFCPNGGAGTACGTSWATGWNVLIDSSSTQLQVGAPVTHGDTLTATTTSTPAYPQFNQAGYTFFTGKLLLADSTATVANNRCIIFSAGSWTTQQGAAC